MGRFQVMAQALAVAGDRLVVIVSVEPDGAVMVRDLANGGVHAANPSELSHRIQKHSVCKLFGQAG